MSCLFCQVQLIIVSNGFLASFKPLSIALFSDVFVEYARCMQCHHPLVGIGVHIFKDGKILLGRRKHSHGIGEFAPPGGHLEYMESFEDCARREVMEETGLEIENIRFLALTNLKDYAPRQYANIGLAADWKRGEPRVMEPDKCESWAWYHLDHLPTPCFATVLKNIAAYQGGCRYFDA